MRHLDLADVLRRAGLNVVEQPGWRTRGFEMGDVRGILAHHTAGSPNGDAPSLALVERGRPAEGIPGPLSQFVLSRSGVWHVVAAGGANHAGKGGPAFGGAVGRDNGNFHLLGVEAENTGRGEPWPEVQLRSYIRGVAALLKDAGLPASRVIGHKEWAPTRKIDPAGIDMNWFRDEVAAEMEDDMPSAKEIVDELLSRQVSLVTDRSKSASVADLLSGANVGAWEAARYAKHQAMGVEGMFHDGGGNAEQAAKSGARELRKLLEAIDKDNEENRKLLLEIKAKVVGT